jgi:hypothetical protein
MLAGRHTPDSNASESKVQDLNQSGEMYENWKLQMFKEFEG